VARWGNIEQCIVRVNWIWDVAPTDEVRLTLNTGDMMISSVCDVQTRILIGFLCWHSSAFLVCASCQGDDYHLSGKPRNVLEYHLSWILTEISADLCQGINQKLRNFGPKKFCWWKLFMATFASLSALLGSTNLDATAMYWKFLCLWIWSV